MTHARSALTVLRHHRSAAPVRWVLTTMALSIGLSMMFGVRPAGADDPAAPVAAVAATTTAAATDAPVTSGAPATRDTRDR